MNMVFFLPTTEPPSPPQVSVPIITTATSATISWTRPANARGPLSYSGNYTNGKAYTITRKMLEH